ncbi:MAG: 50S ribosomal protein L15 [Chloroflexi bacterium]|nr:50S ribosomal protein L15 [Chloroflexota bacterium]|tara:strand:+ start:127 stop:603 length:477 start_codon:yes stop_codon:yes gene_type:complete
MVELHKLKPPVGAKSNRKRKGRGDGSNKGSYSGRGLKGQKARSGGSLPLFFEGGQLPLVKKLPFMRGFYNRFRKSYLPINLDKLEILFESGDKVNPEILYEKNIISKKNSLVKILGKGDLTKSLVVSAHGFSKNAKEKIEKAGGSIEKIESKDGVIDE